MILIPVWNTNGLIDLWPVISEGVEKITDHAGDDETVATVFNRIAGKEVLLWIGYDEGEYVGFITTRVNNLPTQGKNYLFINHAFVKKGKSKTILLEGNEIIYNYAKSMNCAWMSFMTTRKGFEKILKDWNPMYIEFRKEVT